MPSQQFAGSSTQEKSGTTQAIPNENRGSLTVGERSQKTSFLSQIPQSEAKTLQKHSQSVYKLEAASSTPSGYGQYYS